MTSNLIITLVASQFTIIVALVGFAWRTLSKQTSENTELIHQNQTDIKVLENKLWDEDKIMRKIEDTVYHAVTKAENERLKAENEDLKCGGKNGN